MKVREAAPPEYDQLGDIVLAAYAALPGAHLDDDYSGTLRDVAHRANEAVVLAAVGDGGQLLGCITYVPDASSPWAELLEDGEAGIRMLGVHPDAQGLGAGTALTVACIERARAEGKRRVMLHSTPWMEIAHRIYERLGFVRVPERDWRPLPEVPLLCFGLDLAEP